MHFATTSKQIPATLPKIILCGSPEFAVTVFESIINSKQFEVLSVLTETDKPTGRGKEVKPTPVKELALKHALPVFQPSTLKGIALSNSASSGKELSSNNEVNLEFVKYLNSISELDALITVAYGKILPQSLISFPKFGIINAHASLLPRWRGAAPIHRALFSGDKKTGICLMQTVKELDAGSIFCSKETPISETDDFASLHNRLAEISSCLINEKLPLILSGQLQPTPQPELGITHAAKWEAADRQINWKESAETTIRRIKTCSPFGARAKFNNIDIKIYKAKLIKDQNFPKMPPGTIVEANKAELIVAAGLEDFLAVEELQFPGKKRLAISEVLKSKNFQIGQSFSQ